MGDLDAEVVGVSGDNVEGMAIFKKAHGLNFTLLADEKGDVAKKFGVPTRGGGSFDTSVDGKEVTMERGVTSSRWTFIIDKEGKVVHKDTEVNASADSKTVIEAIRRMREAGRGKR